MAARHSDTGTFLGNVLSSHLKSNQVEIDTDSRTQKTVARLKEPRDLFSLPREPECAQEAARWPSECQVVDQKMQHIEAMPGFVEKYYQVTGKEIQPKPASDTDGTVVYSYNPMSAVNYFSRSTSRGNIVAAPPPPKDGDLRFESRFESGNLSKAIKITEAYYQLYLRTDLYTNRHTQWFYFMIENMKKNLIYRFSIVNLCKGESLYSVGMKPVMYSTKNAIEKKLGWHRCGSNITYFRNENGKDEEDPESTYTLSFQIEFPHDGDCVYLAHSYPYTYTNLQEYLVKLQNHPFRSLHTKLRLLCKSLAGNNVYYLTVTEPQAPDEPYKKKKAVVITARVHPGETPSSYMMKGLIDFLTGDSKAAKELRERFIFKLVPMLNPDGVIVGNSRCSLTGRDLNRQYRTVIRETYPPVWHTKVLIRRLMEDCGIALYCDFHAHSSKHNVFIYGCENKRNPEKRLQEQVFPLMLHKNSPDKFSFENCKFRIQKNKEGTGRVVMWMLGIENSYTLEASFAGSTLGLRTCTHFSTVDYEAMGKSFCETLLDFLDDSSIKHIPVEIENKDSLETPKRRIKRRRASKRKRIGLFEEGSPKLPRHPPPIIIYSPPAQRKAMQIPTATIELESSERHSSGDEKTRQSPQQNRHDSAKISIRIDSIHMPPELVITSTQGNDLSVFERLYKSAQLPREISKSPSRRDSCKRCSPVRYVRYASPSNGMSEGEGKQSLHFKQQFWRVLSSGSSTWQNTSDDQDQLLKACSDKLADLKKKHKLKKIKYAETAALAVPKIFFANRRSKRKTRSFPLGRSISMKSEQEQNEQDEISKKKDSMDFNKKDQNGKKTTGKSKKFRKGGIVSLATVHKQNAQEAVNNEEQVDVQTSKKKKKKKKLNQLHKHVKNAVQTVSIVRMTSRKKDKNNTTYKQSSGS